MAKKQPAADDMYARVKAFILKNLLVILIVLLILLLGSGYFLGYRPGPHLTFVRAGNLVLTSLPAGTSVYVDETKRGVSSKGGTMRLLLVPGSHSVIVDAPNDYPWNDLISIKASTDTTASPILIPSKTDTSTLDPEPRAKAAAMVAALQLPASSTPLMLENGCAAVTVSNNRIIASATTTPGCVPPTFLCSDGACEATVIFAPVAKLNSVAKFPGREDALVVGYGDTLAVIELNPLQPQFFAPLAHGVAPKAATYDATSIVETDDNRTLQITL